MVIDIDLIRIRRCNGPLFILFCCSDDSLSHSKDVGEDKHQKLLLKNHACLGGGFKHFLFSSRFGEDSNFDEHIFQMDGSTTNQLAYV